MKIKEVEGMKATARIFTVPGDMVMDILQILVTNGIRFEIQTVKAEDNTLQLQLFPSGHNAHVYHQSVKNIEALLDEYKTFQTYLELNNH